MSAPAPDALDRFLAEYREELSKLAGLRGLVREADEAREKVLAEQALKARKAEGAKPPSLDEAKLVAKASPEYAQATAAWIAHHKALAHAEANVKYLECRWETWRTRAASARKLREMGSYGGEGK